jgi:hypothetical protein
VNDRNHVAELGFKGRVEICAALYRAEAVTVCEFGEDSDIAVVFELDAYPSRQDRELVLKDYARVAMLDALWRAWVVEDFA